MQVQNKTTKLLRHNIVLKKSGILYRYFFFENCIKLHTTPYPYTPLPFQHLFRPWWLSVAWNLKTSKSTILFLCQNNYVAV